MDLKSTLDRCIERGQFMTQEIAKAQFVMWPPETPDSSCISR